MLVREMAWFVIIKKWGKINGILMLMISVLMNDKTIDMIGTSASSSSRYGNEVLRCHKVKTIVRRKRILKDSILAIISLKEYKILLE